MEKYFSLGEEPLRLSLRLSSCGEDWSVLLLGGKQPHIGAVVLAVPRPSLTGRGISCDCWVNPVPGHKDYVTARPLAEQLCTASGRIVAVSAGIHIDHASKEQLVQIQNGCLFLGQQAADWLRQIGSGI